MNVQTKFLRFVIAFCFAAVAVLIAAKVFAADSPRIKTRQPGKETPHTEPAIPASVSAAPTPINVDNAVPPNPSTSVAAIVPSGNVGRTTGSYATPTWSVYYGQIDSIRADSERAQAELDNLKLHHQLDEARKGNFSTTDGAPAQTNGMSFPTMPMAAPVAPAVESGPQRSATVDTVAMVDDHWTATVSLPSGGHVTVREGSNVPGLGKVTSIALSQVLVVANNKTIPLAFTNAAEDTNSPSPTSYSRSNSLPMGIAPPIGLH